MKHTAAVTNRTGPATANIMTSTVGSLKRIVKSQSNIHHPSGRPNVFVFSLPRSGSTWLMELIWSQPGFKFCDEPTDLRNPLIRQHLGIDDWQVLYSDGATDALETYFHGFCSGRLTFMNPSPLRKYYRPRTHRMVFKVIHGCEDRINQFRDTFNGRIVYLIRHPIAVSLSREELPTLPCLIYGDYQQHFTREQMAYAQRIDERGSKLERGVLSWCLQTAVPLRMASPDWAIVSYEQLVVDPYPVIEYIVDKLQLPDAERMMSQLSVPSNSTRKSDGATQQALDRGAIDRRNWLIEKWRDAVSLEEERRLMDILERFEIDVYRFGDVRPTESVWIGPKPVLDCKPTADLVER